MYQDLNHFSFLNRTQDQVMYIKCNDNCTQQTSKSDSINASGSRCCGTASESKQPPNHQSLTNLSKVSHHNSHYL